MKKSYDLAMILRIVGIIISVIALILMIIRPFQPVLAVGVVYCLLIISALFIIVGQIIVLKFVPEEEFSNKLQRTEALYDVITTSVIVGIFIAVYAIPFAVKYLH